MYNVHMQRSAGWSGIVFIVLAIVGAILPGAPPPGTETGQSLVAYLDAHRSAWLFGGWLVFPQTVFFVWFVVGLRNYLQGAPAGDDTLPLYALIGGILSAGVALIAGGIQIALGFVPAADLGPNVVKALYVVWLIAGTPLIFMPTTVLTFASGHCLRRQASAPKWLAAVSYVTAIVCALATLTAFSNTGAMSPSGIAGYVPFFVLVIWVVSTSVVLVRSKVESP
jgi:hypothetical protein